MATTSGTKDAERCLITHTNSRAHTHTHVFLDGHMSMCVYSKSSVAPKFMRRAKCAAIKASPILKPAATLRNAHFGACNWVAIRRRRIGQRRRESRCCTLSCLQGYAPFCQVNFKTNALWSGRKSLTSFLRPKLKYRFLSFGCVCVSCVCH